MKTIIKNSDMSENYTLLNSDFLYLKVYIQIMNFSILSDSLPLWFVSLYIENVKKLTCPNRVYTYTYFDPSENCF